MKGLWVLLLCFSLLLFSGVTSWANDTEQRIAKQKQQQQQTGTITNENNQKRQAPSIAGIDISHSPKTCAYSPFSAFAAIPGGGAGLAIGEESEHCMRLQRILWVDKLNLPKKTATEMKQLIFFENPKNKEAYLKACEWDPVCKKQMDKAKAMKAARAALAHKKKKKECYGFDFRC